MKWSLWLIFGLARLAPAFGETGCAPAEPGWVPESRAESGTLCADVLLASPDPDQEGYRRVRVFEAGKPAFSTEAAALCKSCGGAMGDPFQGIEWQGRTLAVSNYGGSRSSWGETWKFAQREGRWIIAGWDRETVDRLTGDVWHESVNALNGKATAAFEPGADSRRKPRKLACGHDHAMPDIGRLDDLRGLEFACGLKIDLAP